MPRTASAFTSASARARASPVGGDTMTPAAPSESASPPRSRSSRRDDAHARRRSGTRRKVVAERERRAAVARELDERDVDRQRRGAHHGGVDRGDVLEEVALLAHDVLDRVREVDVLGDDRGPKGRARHRAPLSAGAEAAREHVPRRTAHDGATVGANGHREDAAGEMNGDLLARRHEAACDADGDRRAGAGSARMGDADAALPDDEIDRALPIDRELDVRPRGETRMRREARPDGVDDRTWRRARRDRVRVAGVGERELPDVARAGAPTSRRRRP